MRRYSPFSSAGGPALALAIAFLLAVVGCWSKEPPAPAPVVPAPPVAPVTEPAPAPLEPAPVPPSGQPELGPVVPSTLPVLKLAPESAMLTLALPPLNGIIDKALALAKRIAPPDFNVDDEVAKAVSDIRNDLGVPDAASFADIATAKGIQPDAPIGVFVDLAPTATSAKEAFAEFKAALDAQKTTESAPAPEGEKKEGGEAPPAPPAEPPNIEKFLESVKLPGVALVFGCGDPAKVEAAIKDLLSLPGGDIDPEKVETLDVNGVQVKCFDPEKLAYAMADGKMFISNSLEMLKQTLARVASPAVVRYGSVECPAEVPDEWVLLSRFDKIAPLVKDLIPAALAMNKGTAKFADTPLPSIEKKLNAMAGDDPGVTRLIWTDKKIELKTQMDNAKHPAYAELCGEAKPLRLAPLLPEATLALLSLRFNAMAKASFREGWLNALPPEVQKDAGLSQVTMYINQAVELIGDELTFGISAASGGIPQAFLMANLAQPDQVKALIQMFAPMTPAEKHEDVDISIVAVPLPVPIYIAFPEDTVMVANDLDRFKEVITAIKTKTPTNFLGSLDPPVGLDAPMYGILMLKSALVGDIVKPLAGLGGGLTPEMEMPLDKLVENVREIRASQDIENNWQVSKITFYLN